MKPTLSARDWPGKVSAGLVLGFLLALGGSGLFRAVFGIGEAFFSTKGQLSMWLMSPLWALILSLVFLFRSGWRAWGGLAIANALVWGLFALIGGIGA